MDLCNKSLLRTPSHLLHTGEEAHEALSFDAALSWSIKQEFSCHPILGWWALCKFAWYLPPRGYVKPLRTRLLIMVTNALRVRPHCGATNIQLWRHQNRKLYCHAERLHCGWLEPVSPPPFFECTGCLSGDSILLHFLTHVKQTRSHL